MGKRDGAVSAPETGTGRTSLGEADITGMIDQASVTTAGRLRNALADQLCAQGTVRTERVEAALREVPRHTFVPEASVDEAYADAPLYTKTDGAGASISAASQPTIVAMMLEQLQAEPGQRVLELGTGTGYNAGLLAHLVGEHGQVTTIDVDGARSGLAAAGIENVRSSSVMGRSATRTVHPTAGSSRPSEPGGCRRRGWSSSPRTGGWSCR